jgi:hypothetical protein
MRQGGGWEEVSMTEKAVSRHRASALWVQKENTITIQYSNLQVQYNTYKLWSYELWSYELWSRVFTVRKPTIPRFFT